MGPEKRQRMKNECAKKVGRNKGTKKGRLMRERRRESKERHKTVTNWRRDEKQMVRRREKL